ncbi:MAG: D-glycero-alpha-D-manno-heptose-1,7-bisphosphate 7-phosphatase [Rhodococcus sp. (in: high G+C Gram-positive bacteria)]
MSRAIFLDRDGVINRDVGYPHRRSDLHIYADVAPSLRSLASLGFKLIVITNQSGVGRGLFTRDDVDAFHSHLRSELRRQGVTLESGDFYVCPHAPTDNCPCRKPKPGLILQAGRELGIDLEHSYLVGDHERDVIAGRRAGVTTVLLSRRTRPSETSSDWVVRSLREFAQRVEHNTRPLHAQGRG